VVNAVEPESPARKAGLQEGDIILAIGSKKIASPRDYWSIKKTYAAGDSLKTRIWRDNQVKTVSIKSSVFPMERAEDLAFRIMGIRVKNITKENHNYYRLRTREGVVITEIARDSHLDRIGARPGDVIRQMDDISIANDEDFKKAIVKYRQKSSVVVLLQRGDQGYYITVKL
jgi:S1-C subfamily serine protease